MPEGREREREREREGRRERERESVYRVRHRTLYGLSPNDELCTTFTPLRPIKPRVGFQPGGISCPYARERERERERERQRERERERGRGVKVREVVPVATDLPPKPRKQWGALWVEGTNPPLRPEGRRESAKETGFPHVAYLPEPYNTPTHPASVRSAPQGVADSAERGGGCHGGGGLGGGEPPPHAQRKKEREVQLLKWCDSRTITASRVKATIL